MIVDINGVFGVSGAVITGGQVSNSQGGFLSSVLPNEAVDVLFDLNTTFHNPSSYAFDSNGRLLFSSITNPGTSQSGIYATTGIGDDPSLLFSSTSRISGIAIDASDQIHVSTEDGRIEIHALDGSLIDSDFVTDLGFFSPLAFGSLESPDIDLFALDSMGDLLRIDSLGNKEVIGSGFTIAYSSLQFGSDGSLYASDFTCDRILRISATPPSIPEPNALAIMVIFSLAACLGRKRKM